ncbi:hypothetical protein NBRC116594_12030 [Shimia sp. NS0008-38b]|uniref:hypothetical protein n=1 Tax=Shimia sp. NS0008-38b TaxID=3127653 RepID=UPI003102D462
MTNTIRVNDEGEIEVLQDAIGVANAVISSTVPNQSVEFALTSILDIAAQSGGGITTRDYFQTTRAVIGGAITFEGGPFAVAFGSWTGEKIGDRLYDVASSYRGTDYTQTTSHTGIVSENADGSKNVEVFSVIGKKR